jgi:hypothetical protein
MLIRSISLITLSFLAFSCKSSSRNKAMSSEPATDDVSDPNAEIPEVTGNAHVDRLVHIIKGGPCVADVQATPKVIYVTSQTEGNPCIPFQFRGLIAEQEGNKVTLDPNKTPAEAYLALLQKHTKCIKNAKNRPEGFDIETTTKVDECLKTMTNVFVGEKRISDNQMLFPQKKMESVCVSDDGKTKVSFVIDYNSEAMNGIEGLIFAFSSAEGEHDGQKLTFAPCPIRPGSLFGDAKCKLEGDDSDTYAAYTPSGIGALAQLKHAGVNVNLGCTAKGN